MYWIIYEAKQNVCFLEKNVSFRLLSMPHSLYEKHEQRIMVDLCNIACQVLKQGAYMPFLKMSWVWCIQAWLLCANLLGGMTLARSRRKFLDHLFGCSWFLPFSVFVCRSLNCKRHVFQSLWLILEQQQKNALIPYYSDHQLKCMT